MGKYEDPRWERHRGILIEPRVEVFADPAEQFLGRKWFLQKQVP